MATNERKSWRIDPSHDHPFHQSPEAFQALLGELTRPESTANATRLAEGEMGPCGVAERLERGLMHRRPDGRKAERNVDGVAVEQLIDWQANLEERERSLSLREAELVRAWVLLKERQAVFEREARGLLEHLSHRVG